jgi:Protein of unknown function (DUF3293)
MTQQELHQAFLNTSFKVFIDPHCTIKINALVPELSDLNSWAFLTAWNPSPEVLRLDENRKRNQNLEEDLKELGLRYIQGLGISEDEQWSEESFLIENCSLEKANELAVKYKQLAFVTGKKDEVAKLIYTIF